MKCLKWDQDNLPTKWLHVRMIFLNVFASYSDFLKYLSKQGDPSTQFVFLSALNLMIPRINGF